MVGNLGQDEFAAVSLANTPFFICMLMLFGLQSGGCVLISQYWGKRDMPTISRIIGAAWVSALGLSLVFAAGLSLFPRQIMSLITDNESLVGIAARYCKMAAFSQVFNAFAVIYIGARRACGSPRLGTFVMSAGALLNVLFNYTFIYGHFGFPAMHVEGAALSSVLARGCEAIIVIIFICFRDKKNPIMPLFPRCLLKPGKVILRDFLRYSGPVVMNETLWSTGTSLYVVIYGHMAASGVIMAAYSLTMNIERFANTIVFAISNCTAVFIGKAIGEGQKRGEVHALGKTFMLLAVIVSIISGVLLAGALFTIIQPFVFPMVHFSEAARQICVFMLLTLSVTLFCRAFNMTLVVGVLRGGGDVSFGLLLDTGTMYLWSLPLAALAAFVFNLDIWWVYLLVISEEPIKASVGYLRFRSGRWINNVTREIAGEG
jgi:putative MATE family efflux protein